MRGGLSELLAPKRQGATARHLTRMLNCHLRKARKGRGVNKKDNSELTDQKKGNEGRKTGIKKGGGGYPDYTLLPFPRDSSVHSLVLTHGTWKSPNAEIHTYDCVDIRVCPLLCLAHT